jgi:uncharacterized protein (TIGR00251 family)
MIGFTLLKVRLTPRGGRDAVARYEDGVLHARVAAPPIDGAANRALIDLIAATLKLPKSRVQIQSGETGRDKTLRIEGFDAETLRMRLEERECRK